MTVCVESSVGKDAPAIVRIRNDADGGALPKIHEITPLDIWRNSARMRAQEAGVNLDDVRELREEE